MVLAAVDTRVDRYPFLRHPMPFGPLYLIFAVVRDDLKKQKQRSNRLVLIEVSSVKIQFGSELCCII